MAVEPKIKMSFSCKDKRTTTWSQQSHANTSCTYTLTVNPCSTHCWSACGQCHLMDMSSANLEHAKLQDVENNMCCLRVYTCCLLSNHHVTCACPISIERTQCSFQLQKLLLVGLWKRHLGHHLGKTASSDKQSVKLPNWQTGEGMKGWAESGMRCDTRIRGEGWKRDMREKDRSDKGWRERIESARWKDWGRNDRVKWESEGGMRQDV